MAPEQDFGMPPVSTAAAGQMSTRPEGAADAEAELRTLSLRGLIVQLAGTEDAIRMHRCPRGSAEEGARADQLRYLGGRQRRILRELRRRARARARLGRP